MLKRPSKQSKSMVSTTEVGGDNKPNSKANWKNKPKSENPFSKFTGAAKSDSVLYQKVITSGRNQDGQTLSLVETLPSYIGIKGYADCAESMHDMEKKDEDDFKPTVVPKRDFGTVNNTGVFEWHADALDTEDEYNRDYEPNINIIISYGKNRDGDEDGGEDGEWCQATCQAIETCQATC